MGMGGEATKRILSRSYPCFQRLVLGPGTETVDLSLKRRLQNEIELGINLQGNSGATRFLFSVVSSLDAKK